MCGLDRCMRIKRDGGLEICISLGSVLWSRELQSSENLLSVKSGVKVYNIVSECESK